jgi:hypothetical protein
MAEFPASWAGGLRTHGKQQRARVGRKMSRPKELQKGAILRIENFSDVL